MRKLFSLLIIMFLISCNEQKSTVHLEREITLLNYRIDSLVQVLQLLNSEKEIVQNSTEKARKSTNKKVQPKPVVIRTQSTSTQPSYYTSTTSTRSSSSGRCQGITKKGYQCSRRVKSGAYCWQHG